ncbi:DUF3027 domain-containing protein [Lysinibacter sp. HNR]|uniref:DUF3027 domain-containing protein n=1 Tax=Lysinibacter sp. HNR TaxID=3031408 RepID=UPI0024350796|nr:DUF3027 domain-containing protein [Lysinibacter sp. HNR]WGD36985.1 DUF3027 domain-containing protein [Lysinibacter sp. HNR]
MPKDNPEETPEANAISSVEAAGDETVAKVGDAKLPGGDMLDADVSDGDVSGADTGLSVIEYAADGVLLAAHELARKALIEITPESTIGDVMGYTVEGEHVLSLHFTTTLPGYPGWYWSATLARVAEGVSPTVVEVELLPGEGALLAPDWVPWSVRLAQFLESQALLEEEERIALEEAALELDDDEDDDEDDILVNDFSDFDDEIDGVDVDSVLDSDDEDSDDEEDPSR